MPAERLAVYSTVYPGVEPFLAAWHASVRAQTDVDFDLWLGSDGLTRHEVATAAGGRVGAEWVPAQVGDTPAALRGRAIGRMAGRYGAVVFVDADDLLEPQRVAAARAALATRDVDACALRYADATGRPVDGTLAPSPGDDPVAALPWRNVFGLSNTAYRTGTLRRCLPIPPACAMPDWLLATRAWLLGASLGFDRSPHMRYRQHGGNVAPTRRPVTDAVLRRAIGMVSTHYRHVLAATWTERPNADPARVALVAAAGARAARFARQMLRRERRTSYLRALDALPDERVPRAWWWMIAHPDLEALWNR